ncbi:GSCFA domain-containing protein [Rhizobium sp. TRM95796]|uniref:GSCFA domain-containing protein n=1 Tax=Rhizobium sp. TRM95796 TaxID=2979862 RepID=UPI0021E78D9D|nr:GSCFA domain-containing protein [Rhizobium sp. TRM95796]MCV3765512.1 GSCFA domain-containing protein [Rhizobium sp. TRM95796]
MHPYKSLPDKAFWRPSVAELNAFEVNNLWSPKFKIKPDSKVATYGSCFAQHIGNALQDRGFNWFITEQPIVGLPPEFTKKYNYNIFTSRTGNIYTTSILKQWVSWASGEATPPDEYWEANGRIFDPFRPTVEPEGFESIEEMRMAREETIKRFKQSIVESDFFVFTLGLTESWVNIEGGYEYPLCPGTVQGEFDPAKHVFVNQDFPTVRNNLQNAILAMRSLNPRLRFILTVSPVPLTATASGEHVVLATMYSKSVLRAVAGLMEQTRRFIDYFPSYEIINSPVFKGAFFEPNMRSVSAYGVRFVMDTFFQSLKEKYGDLIVEDVDAKAAQASADVVCEEELLGAFGGGQ